LNVSLATSVTPELESLWGHARHDVLAKRGGVALMTTLLGSVPEDDLLAHVVTTSSLWTCDVDGELVGLCLCRFDVIEAVYVTHDRRRQKVATTLVKALLEGSMPPLDAYALPGDRATKSLYESLGWKARLLTMRGA
jgi:Acetyltransferase (GNAT) domain